MKVFLIALGFVFLGGVAALHAYPADRKETLVVMAVVAGVAGVVRWLGAK